MNRKFVKENKQVLREFLAGIIASVLAAKGSREINKSIDKHPALKSKRDKLRVDVKDYTKRVKAYIKKQTPEKRKALEKAFAEYL